VNSTYGVETNSWLSKQITEENKHKWKCKIMREMSEKHIRKEQDGIRTLHYIYSKSDV
jgi:hypothetical protein